jgi:hypothetical protein
MLQLRVPLCGAITITREAIIDRDHMESGHRVQLGVRTRMVGFVAGLPSTAMYEDNDWIDALVEQVQISCFLIRHSVGPTPELREQASQQVRLAVVQTARDGERELTTMRWGFPPPQISAVKNVRNLKSPYWRGWLKNRMALLGHRVYGRHRSNTPSRLQRIKRL